MQNARFCSMKFSAGIQKRKIFVSGMAIQFYHIPRYLPRMWWFMVSVCCFCLVYLLFRFKSYAGDVFVPEDFDFLNHFHIVPKKKCHQAATSSPSSQSLAVFVTSRVDEWDLRTAIRQTWAARLVEILPDARIYFVFGIPKNFNDHDRNRLLKEAKKYGDVIQGNFIDSYRNLTLKTYTINRWFVSMNCSSLFLLKIDTDTFLYPDLLKTLLTDLTGKVS